MPPSETQVPPTMLAADSVKQQQIELSKQRQDRLDRERLEKNIKWGLGIAGSVGIAALGAYQFNQKMNMQQQRYALDLQEVANRVNVNATNAAQRDIANELAGQANQLRAQGQENQLAIAQTAANATTINAGLRLAGTVVQEVGASTRAALGGVGKVVRYAPRTTAALALGTGVYLSRDQIPVAFGSMIGANSVNVPSGFIKGVFQGATKAGLQQWDDVVTQPILRTIGSTGEALYQVGSSTYNTLDDAVKSLYEVYLQTPVEKHVSYKKFRSQFPSLRGNDPIYQNTTGLILPSSQMPADVLQQVYSTISNSGMFTNEQSYVDLVKGYSVRTMPSEVFNLIIADAPKDDLAQILKIYRIKEKPRYTKTAMGSSVFQRQLDLWEAYNSRP